MILFTYDFIYTFIKPYYCSIFYIIKDMNNPKNLNKRTDIGNKCVQHRKKHKLRKDDIEILKLPKKLSYQNSLRTGL